MSIIIKVEELSKQYRLGQVGTGTLSHDVNRWWHSIRGKEDPYHKISEVNDRTVKGTTDYVWALKDINFQVEQGEVIGIIGRNGAGKSTLLKILSRTTVPTKGIVKIKGRIASLLEVGTGFHPELSGRENIFLNGAILGMTKNEIKRNFDEIVDFASVERYIDTPVKRYSSGMYVRLAFAVAAHLDPEILIVDEVLAVGDMDFQKKALGKMKSVSQKDGRTVLFVSHHIAALQSFCTKGILLQNGITSFIGSISGAIEAYQKSSKPEVIELSNIGRTGSNKAIFSDFIIENSQGKNVSEIISGESPILKFIIDSSEDIKQVDIGFSFHNEYGESLTVNFSSYYDKYFSLKKGKNIITCEIPSLPLAPGNYNLMIRLETPSSLLDWPSGFVKQLTIIQGDYYGSKNLNLHKNSLFYLDTRWEYA